MGGAILRICLLPLWPFDSSMGILEGDARVVMFWRRYSIKVLPYLNDFMFKKHGFWQCARLARLVEGDFIHTGLKINVPKCHTIPAKQREVARFRRGLCGRQVPGPGRPLRCAQASGDNDFFRVA